jgi:hypothetical protein
VNSMTANSRWIIEFCQEYAPTLFSVGKWTILAGVALGIALAAAAVIASLRAPTAANQGVRNVAAPPTAVLDALRAFIQAIASAPTWLALFGGGLLLLWMSGNTAPDFCRPPLPPEPKSTQPAAAPPTPRTGPGADKGTNLDAAR